MVDPAPEPAPGNANKAGSADESDPRSRANGDEEGEFAIVRDPDGVAQTHAERFAARLHNVARHTRKYPTKRGITCYRLYERDVPEVPLVVDRYEDHLHIGEFEGKATAQLHRVDPEGHARWLETQVAAAARVLEVPRDKIFVKQRYRQRGRTQHESFDSRAYTMDVNEGGLKFRVNLSDYVDTGLFLDHRKTRDMFRREAEGKRVLNLFAYTGAFTVYAAAGKAATTTTVDLSATYGDWTKINLRLNGFDGPEHSVVRSDVVAFLKDQDLCSLYDLAFIDPPTFSNSKRTETDWQVGRDHTVVLNETLWRMPAGGVVYFSNNFRGFELDEREIDAREIREISRQTIPDDFRNKRIHRCWRMVK